MDINKPAFRPDIEGLRALAVILVILYHYQVPGITGGFIGVDVFFVISGFVITQLLERALARGTFRFRDFYARRIRRLVPLFLLVSTATFLLISPFYIGDAYYIAAKSWLASLIGLSNIYYFQELSQYFAPEAQSLPLLHTWSLAVEEQFYFLWPAALFLALRKGDQNHNAIVFIVTFFAFFALSVYMAFNQPTAAYYLLPARIFEFMLGTGVALFSNRLPTLNRISAETLSLLGITLIISTALLLTKHDIFPGLNALWPTLGTALVIYTGLQHNNTVAARLLSTPVMVFLGGISYSLYLWHWPPVALIHYQLLELTWQNTTALIAIVTLLSWLSFRFIENRYRNRPWSFKKSFLILIVIPAILIWAVVSTIRIADDLSFRFPAEKRELYKIIVNNNAGDLYKRCFKSDPVKFNQSSRCLFGQPTEDGKPNSMILGDSHAIAQIGFIETLLEGTDLYALMVTKVSTPFLTTDVAETVYRNDQPRYLRSKALTDYLSEQESMTLFVGAWWNSYLRNEEYQDHFYNSIQWLITQGHNVIILEDAPELPSSAYAECLLKNMDDCSVDAQAVEQRTANFYRLKEQLSSDFPQIKWLNLRQAICDKARCQTVLNGIPLYRDESHLNNVGAKEIGRVYRQRFGNPLAP